MPLSVSLPPRQPSPNLFREKIAVLFGTQVRLPLSSGKPLPPCSQPTHQCMHTHRSPVRLPVGRRAVPGADHLPAADHGRRGGRGFRTAVPARREKGWEEKRTPSVRVQYDPASPQAAYAARVLEGALAESGYNPGPGRGTYAVQLTLNAAGLGREAFAIRPEGSRVTVEGGDNRGLLYGALALAEDLRNGVKLSGVRARRESPHLPFRALKFKPALGHLPAQLRPRPALPDLPQPGLLAGLPRHDGAKPVQRPTLWNLHPFPFMIRPKTSPKPVPSPTRNWPNGRRCTGASSTWPRNAASIPTLSTGTFS
jgi:hypothetical protein